MRGLIATRTNVIKLDLIFSIRSSASQEVGKSFTGSKPSNQRLTTFNNLEEDSKDEKKLHIWIAKFFNVTIVPYPMNLKQPPPQTQALQAAAGALAGPPEESKGDSRA